MNSSNSTFQIVKKIVVILFASFLFALNINTFVDAGGLYPGGAAGLSLLIQRCASMYLHLEIPYTVINMICNAFPLYIGFRFIGKKFTMYSLLMIVATNIFTDILPTFAITSDILLISVFGGLMSGLAIALCLNMDATSGGTDFISIYLSERSGSDSFNIILGINIVILGTAGAVFGWDKALYSIIFQYASTQVIHLLYKEYQQTTLLIITNKYKEVCDTIYETAHHGATIVDGKGYYTGQQRMLVYSIVSGRDMNRTVHAIKTVDPDAFVNVVKTERLSGGFYHKPTT